MSRTKLIEKNYEEKCASCWFFSRMYVGICTPIYTASCSRTGNIQACNIRHLHEPN